MKPPPQPIIDADVAPTANKEQGQQHDRIGRGKLDAVVNSDLDNRTLKNSL